MSDHVKVKDGALGLRRSVYYDNLLARSCLLHISGGVADEYRAMGKLCMPEM
jgi:hypothetical protein